MESSKTEDTDAQSVSNDQQVKENVICLEEATVDDIPHSLKHLLNSLPPDSLNEKELFTIILYIVSIESGFTWNKFIEDVPLHRRTYSFDIRRLRSIPNNSYVAWSTKCNRYEKILYLGGVEDFKCTLVATPWKNTITVHISNSATLLCFSSIFILSEFIHQNSLKYDKTKELVVKLRNDLFHPMKSYILTEASIANPSLLGLPLEIITNIVEYLTVKDFLNLCASSRHFHDNLSELDSVWVFFCKQFCLTDKPDNIVVYYLYILAALAEETFKMLALFPLLRQFIDLDGEINNENRNEEEQVNEETNPEHESRLQCNGSIVVNFIYLRQNEIPSVNWTKLFEATKLHFMEFRENWSKFEQYLKTQSMPIEIIIRERYVVLNYFKGNSKK